MLYLQSQCQAAVKSKTIMMFILEVIMPQTWTRTHPVTTPAAVTSEPLSHIGGKNSFVKPLQMLQPLSSFPNLQMLYTTFCCLVSSASAERALGKLRIVKNRLRSSLCDRMLASLLVLASERDILQYMKTDDIIDRLANDVPSLKAHLLYI